MCTAGWNIWANQKTGMDSIWNDFARNKKSVMRTLSVNWNIPLDNLMFYLLRIIFWYAIMVTDDPGPGPNNAYFFRVKNMTLFYAVAYDPGPGLLSFLTWQTLINFPSHKQIITISRWVLSRIQCLMSHSASLAIIIFRGLLIWLRFI